MGIDTSYEHFAKERGNHETLFAEAVADLYGVEPENVVVTVGASEAIFLACSVCGTRKAVIPLPNYEPMFTVPRSLGVKVVSSLRLSKTASGVLIGLTNPNNPTGRRIDGEVKAFVHSTRKGKATVYVNETYREFAFERKAQTLFRKHPDLVASGTMTKFYGLGRLRAGWLFASPERALQLRRAKRLVTGHNAEYSLWLARQAVLHRKLFVDRAKSVYVNNRGIVRDFVRKTPSLSWSNPDAAPFCLMKYENGPDSVTLARLALKRSGVAVAPGDYFGAPKAFRLCFTGESDKLRRGLERLSEFLGKELS